MSEPKLYGMKAAFDEIIATAVKRQHEPQRIIGDLLSAEITEKQARSVRYQITIAKLPLAKDLAEFRFDNTPVNIGTAAKSKSSSVLLGGSRASARCRSTRRRPRSASSSSARTERNRASGHPSLSARSADSGHSRATAGNRNSCKSSGRRVVSTSIVFMAAATPAAHCVAASG
jgi:hypothetical protein